MALVMMLHTLPSYASEPELLKRRATAYCLEGITYSGQQVRENTCATADASLIGSVIIAYKRMPDDSIGELIGIYEVTDLMDTTREGAEYCIDFWVPKEELHDFANLVWSDGCQGKIWIQIIKAEG